MKIKLSDGSEIYCRVSDILSVSIVSHYLTDSENVYEVLVGFGSQMPYCIYNTKNKTIAKEAMFKIGELIEDESNEKTYLDGFKNGTEYALKLMEKNHV